jgi:hypothetical protein
MGGADSEEFQTTMQDNLEEEPKLNLDQLINIIQVEHVVLIAKPKEPIVVAAKSSQPVQPIVEYVHVKNP